jgi:hypothetical protein
MPISPSFHAADRPHVLSLSSRLGDAADVAPQHGDGIPVEVELDLVEPARWQVLADLSVIGPG